MKSESKRCHGGFPLVCDIADECKPFHVPDRCPALRTALERAREKSKRAPLCMFNGSPCDMFRVDRRGRVTFSLCVVKADHFVCDRFDADFNAVLPREFRKRCC